MEITKKEFEQMQNDPWLLFLAGLSGIDLKKVKWEDIKNKYEVEEESKPETVTKKEYIKPETKELPKFVMTKDQFRGFCGDYNALVKTIKTLEHVYGISLDSPASGKNISELVRNIIWNFVRIIFGDENADDIADFLYGNSNFDSSDALYEELT